MQPKTREKAEGAGAFAGPATPEHDPGAAGRPLLMVDIDGVISLFGVPPEGGEDDASPRGSLHAVDGMVHFLSATAAAHLLELSELYELVWASGWEERADEHLPRLLGLPSGLPHLRFGREPGSSGAHWKLEAIERFAQDRALAWVDDCFNDACHRLGGGAGEPHLAGRDRAPVGPDSARELAAAGVGRRPAGRARAERAGGEARRHSARGRSGGGY